MRIDNRIIFDIMLMFMVRCSHVTNNSRGRPVGPLILLPKKAQLRSKTASSSTTQKVEVLLKGEKRLNFAPKRPL